MNDLLNALFVRIKQRFFALLLNAFMLPGAGQILLKRYKRGIVFMGLSLFAFSAMVSNLPPEFIEMYANPDTNQSISELQAKIDNMDISAFSSGLPIVSFYFIWASALLDSLLNIVADKT